MRRIPADDLRRTEDQEGLVLQGCGGNLQEWLDGMNGLLTKEGILLNGSKFENASPFENGGMTNLLLPFDGVELDMGKLALWRLRTHAQFGGTWLSDYVPNKLGGFLQKQEVPKPDCRLIGENGNIFRGLVLHAMETEDNEDALSVWKCCCLAKRFGEDYPEEKELFRGDFTPNYDDQFDGSLSKFCERCHAAELAMPQTVDQSEQDTQTGGMTLA